MTLITLRQPPEEVEVLTFEAVGLILKAPKGFDV